MLTCGQITRHCARMISRPLNAVLRRSATSDLLLGPRRTGKWTLMAQLEADLRGLRVFADFFGKRHRALVLCLGAERRRIEGIDVLPWQEGLRALGL